LTSYIKKQETFYSAMIYTLIVKKLQEDFSKYFRRSFDLKEKHFFVMLG